jgi:hypothetical protein
MAANSNDAVRSLTAQLSAGTISLEVYTAGLAAVTAAVARRAVPQPAAPQPAVAQPAVVRPMSEYELLSTALGFQPTAKDFRRWAPAVAPAAAVARRAALAEERLLARAGVLDARMPANTTGAEARALMDKAAAAQGVDGFAEDAPEWRTVAATVRRGEVEFAIKPPAGVSHDLILSMHGLTDAVTARVLERRAEVPAVKSLKWALSVKCVWRRRRRQRRRVGHALSHFVFLLPLVVLFFSLLSPPSSFSLLGGLAFAPTGPGHSQNPESRKPTRHDERLRAAAPSWRP